MPTAWTSASLQPRRRVGGGFGSEPRLPGFLLVRGHHVVHGWRPGLVFFLDLVDIAILAALAFGSYVHCPRFLRYRLLVSIFSAGPSGRLLRQAACVRGGDHRLGARFMDSGLRRAP